MIRYLSSCCVLLVAAFAAESLGAAELTVPGTHETIAAAIAAAASSDTIRLTTAGPFAGDLVIDKAVTIMTNSGTTATIAGVVTTADGAGGGKLGSIDAGRIVIDGGGAAPASILGTGHSGTTPFTYENIVVRNITGGVVIAPGSPGYVDYNYIECTGGATQAIDYTTSASGAVINVLRSRLTNTLSSTMTPEGSAVLNASYCEFSSNVINVVVVYGFNGFTANMDHCWIPGAGATPTVPAIELRTPTITLHLSYCTITRDGGNGIKLRINEHSNSTLIMDHCDVIANNTQAFLIQQGTPQSTNRTFSITNCNIRGTAAFSYAAGPSDTWTAFAYNNNWSPTTGWPAGVTLGLGNIDGGPDPVYNGIATGDYTYQTESLKTAGLNGTPIGSMFAFPAQLGPPPPVVNRTSGWSHYE